MPLAREGLAIIANAEALEACPLCLPLWIGCAGGIPIVAACSTRLMISGFVKPSDTSLGM
eukprot:CAMPEP_0115091338 /NCGR_PEP_ID=MMETSP0227-20121206/26035_1 /TAXON_ID=89957 /ORGANISM="Polarella glacialis, Strain CCMP 1383" /LENGTH=59 /DNA_ID=CAMNT_0002482795 /DNA_START=479 /DNA_END=658 /DNA_ORIENTATION=-